MKLEVDTKDIRDYGTTKAVIIRYLRRHPDATTKGISVDITMEISSIYKHTLELERLGKVKRIRKGREMIGAIVYD